jgi:membrane-associated protease RseP (regulator of RpoE activity)
LIAYLLGVLVIAFGVAASIALHEIGHLVPAKRFGVKCTQYMVGFGPTIWSRRKGETEYGLKAIPLGGYVRMIGMFPPAPGRPARADTTGRWSLMIEQARNEAQREVGPEDDDRLFYKRSVPKRLIIMLGGPFMNLVIAVVLLTITVTAFGIPDETPRLSSVSKCVLPVDAPADATCGPDDEAAPAADAGLKPGDVITSFDGAAVSSWEDVRDAIRANPETQVTIGFERDGAEQTVTVSPILDARPVFDADGNPVVRSDGTVVTEKVGFLGVTPSRDLVPQPITEVPGYIGSALAQTAGVVLRIPEKMVGVAQAAFGDAERDPNGPVSIVGVGRFAGEVASAESTEVVQLSTADRFAQLLLLLASLNLALFVFNLIPLLPLDGGHAAGAVWEGLRRQFAKVRSRPDPGPVDVARALPLAYGVASLLIGMSVLLIYADIVRPIRLGG